MTDRAAETKTLALEALPIGVPTAFASRTIPALRRLAARLEEGVAWDTAFADYWLEVVSHKPRDWPPPDGRVNWTWLTDLDRLERAVDLGSAFAEVAASLSGECREVVYLCRNSLHRSVVERRALNHMEGVQIASFERRGDWPKDGFDLVTFVASSGWRERLPNDLSTLRRVVDHAADVLRPGGWFGILTPNPVWYHQFRLGPRSVIAHLQESYRLGNLERRLLSRGFTDIRQYVATASSLIPHATPLASLDVSMMFIPKRKDALASYLAMFGLQGRRAKLVEYGLGGLLFPVHLTLARI